MSDEKKYTAEDIRRAIERVELRAGTDVRAAVMTELERPAPRFREGEVVSIYRDNDWVEFAEVGDPRRFQRTYPEARRLRLSEMPEAVSILRSEALLAGLDAAVAAFDSEIVP